MRTIIFALFVTFNCTVFSIVPLEVKEAIEKIDYRFIDFSYNIVDDQVFNGEKLVRVSEFHPKNEILFNLQSKNGKTATLNDKKRYNKDKINLFGKDRFVMGTDFTFRKLAKADNYKLIERKNDCLKYEFINANSIIPDNDAPLKGTLTIDSNTNEIRKILLENIEPLDVFFGISLSHIELEFHFEPSDLNYCLIKDIKCKIYGQVLFVGIDYVSRFSMSNYNSIN